MARKITKDAIEKLKENKARAEERLHAAQEKLDEASNELELAQLRYDAQCWRDHLASQAGGTSAVADDSFGMFPDGDA